MTHKKRVTKWIGAKTGDYIHVPSGTEHAWRNVSAELVVYLIITTKRQGPFFWETGRPVSDASQPVTPEDLRALRLYLLDMGTGTPLLKRTEQSG